MTAASEFFDDLFETLTGRRGAAKVMEICPYCHDPVTNDHIDDSEAFMIDERGPDDGRYAHRSCAQAAKEP